VKLLFYSTLSGLLLGLAFPPLPFWFLAFIGFIPLLIALEESTSKKSSFSILYLTFFVYHGLTNWWISSWQQNTDPYLFAAGIAVWIVHPFFLMVPAVFYLILKKYIGSEKAIALFPFLWTLFEWIHSLGELSYPWLSVGYTQLTNIHWVQFADLGGVWLVTLMIVFANSLLFRFYMQYKKIDSFSFKILLLTPKLRAPIIGFLCCLILPYAYGFIKFRQFDYEKLLLHNPKTTISIVQPNINPWEKWEDVRAQGIKGQLQIHFNLLDSLHKTKKKEDLSIWCETALPDLLFEPRNTEEFASILKYVDSNSISILTGFADIKRYNTKAEASPTAKESGNVFFETFNAAVLLSPQPHLNTLNVHRKMRLTPFAERLPYAESFSFAIEALKWGVGISSWGIGKEQNSLKFVDSNGSTIKVGTIICIESIYPDFVRQYVIPNVEDNSSAKVLVVITNDAWYDHTPGPRQHFYISAMRAIETRRVVVRSANTGVSGFISPLGETIYELPQYTRVAGSATIPLMSQSTFYILQGDWIPKGCLLICVLFPAYYIIRKRIGSVK